MNATVLTKDHVPFSLIIELSLNDYSDMLSSQPSGKVCRDTVSTAPTTPTPTPTHTHIHTGIPARTESAEGGV